MWSICKKELRQAFSSLTGYIAIIVFLVVNGLVLFVLRNNILEFGYATLDPFFSFAPWVLMFLISAITMRSFSDEFRSGTFEVLQTRPIGTGQIVVGKFFGAFIVAIIALLPTLVYYFTINHLAAGTGIDSGAAIGSYLGLALLTAVFTAIGICVSSFTSNSVVAFIISLIACVLFYYGFSALSELPPFQSGADYYIEMLGINFHYQSISKGVTDTRDVIYFISLVVFLLLLTKTRLTKQTAARQAGGALRWVGLVAGLFIINFIAAKFHLRKDLTEEKRYSLSPTTKELVRNLQSNVVVDVFLTGDLPSGFRKLSNSTQEFIALLKETAPEKIQYRFISPDEDAGNGKPWADSLKKFGIEPINLSVQVKAGEENKNIFPYAIIHGNEKATVVNLFSVSKRSITGAELNNAEATMEYEFAKGLSKITSVRKPLVAYALGNGQPEGPETFSLREAIDPEKIPANLINPKLFQPGLKSDYEFGLFDIGEQKVIPATIDALLIVKPVTAFTEAEKLKIDQYIMHGGKVLWLIDNLFADSLNFKTDMIAYDRNLNLNDLFFNYGARINTDLIMDLQCDFLRLKVGGSDTDPQYEALQWSYWPWFESRNTHPINKNLGLVASRFVNSVDTVEASGIKKTFLLQSSPNSRTISTPALISLNENRNVTETNQFKKNAVPAGVILEGKFSSFYKNRIGKAQLDSLQLFGGFKEQNSIENKMIIVADGDIILNDVDRQEGPLPLGMNKFTFGSKYQYPVANRAFLLNCLEYLTGNSGLIQTRNKEIVLRLLDPKKTEAEKTKWGLINIALPVLLIIIFGVIYQRVRRYRFAS